MVKQILSEEFRRMQKLAGLITENEENIPEEEKIKDQLSKIGVKKTTVKIIDKRNNKTSYVSIDNNELKPTDNIEEGLKDKILIGAVCTILASGMVSCKKGPGGFGYNVSVKTTVHDLTKGNLTKEITVFTPNGQRTVMVNPNDTSRASWAGHGMHVAVAPTPEELQIMAFGSAIRSEENSNNGKGYDDNRYVMDVTKAEIIRSRGYEEDPASTAPLSSIKEYPSYKRGIKLIQQYPDQWEEFKKINPVQGFDPS